MKDNATYYFAAIHKDSGLYRVAKHIYPYSKKPETFGSVLYPTFTEADKKAKEVAIAKNEGYFRNL